MEKCISVLHDREKNVCFRSLKKRYFDWGRFWKIFYEHNENPRPHPDKKMVVALGPIGVLSLIHVFNYFAVQSFDFECT